MMKYLQKENFNTTSVFIKRFGEVEQEQENTFQYNFCFY